MKLIAHLAFLLSAESLCTGSLNGTDESLYIRLLLKCSDGDLEGVKVVLANPASNPDLQVGEALKVLVKDANFKVLQLLLDDPRIDPMFKMSGTLTDRAYEGSNELLAAAVEDGDVKLLKKLLSHPRIMPNKYWEESICVLTLALRLGHQCILGCLMRDPKIELAYYRKIQTLPRLLSLQGDANSLRTVLCNSKVASANGVKWSSPLVRSLLVEPEIRKVVLAQMLNEDLNFTCAHQVRAFEANWDELFILKREPFIEDLKEALETPGCGKRFLALWALFSRVFWDFSPLYDHMVEVFACNCELDFSKVIEHFDETVKALPEHLRQRGLIYEFLPQVRKVLHISARLHRNSPKKADIRGKLAQMIEFQMLELPVAKL